MCQQYHGSLYRYMFNLDRQHTACHAFTYPFHLARLDHFIIIFLLNSVDKPVLMQRHVLTSIVPQTINS